MTSNNVKSTEKHNVDGTILAEYTIHKRIGKGAYGIVYKAFDKGKKQHVAIKKIFDAFRNKTDAQRTYREILFLKSFQRHPNIITMLDIYEAVNNRDLYVVFEYMENDLNKVIRDKILKDVHIRFIMFQLCNGLSYIHGCKVMHRDLKPSNILIDKSCSIKIGDLGLARSLDNSEDCLTEYIATRWYRAPEILISNRNYTQNVDIWSLGCILAEMLQSKPLFAGASTNHQLQMIVNVVRSSPPHADKFYTGFKNKPEDAIDLLHTILILNPAQRPNTEVIRQHPYVSKYFPSETYSIPEVVPHSIVMDVNDNNQLEIEEYQDRLYEIVKKSKKKKAMKRLSKDTQQDIHQGSKSKDNIYSKVKASEKENVLGSKHTSQQKIKSNSGILKLEEDPHLNIIHHNTNYDIASTSDCETNDGDKKNYIVYNKQNVANYSQHRRKDSKQQTHLSVANISNGETPVLVTSKTYHVDKNHVKHVSKTWLDPSTREMRKTNGKEYKTENGKNANNVSRKCSISSETSYYQPKLSHKVACKKSEIKINDSSNKKSVPAITCEEIESELIRRHSISNSLQNVDTRHVQDANRKVDSVQDMANNKKWGHLSNPYTHQHQNGQRPSKYYIQDDDDVAVLKDLSHTSLFQSEKISRRSKKSKGIAVPLTVLPSKGSASNSNTYWIEAKNKKCPIDTPTLYMLSDKANLLHQHGDNNRKSNGLDISNSDIAMGRRVERKLKDTRLLHKYESQCKFETHEVAAKDSNEPKYFGTRDPLKALPGDKNYLNKERTDVSHVSYVPSAHNTWSMCNGDKHTSQGTSYTFDNKREELSPKQIMYKNCFFDKILNYYNPITEKSTTPDYGHTQRQSSNKYCETESHEGNNIFQCFKKNKPKVKACFNYNKHFNEKLQNMHKLSVLNFNIAPLSMDDDMNEDQGIGNPVRLLKPDLHDVASDFSVSDEKFCRYYDCDW